MKRENKNQLDIFFAAPKPRRKQEFLRQVARRRKKQKHFLLSILLLQCRYISPVIWLVSGGFFALVLVANYFVGEQLLIPVFALAPFLVMLSVTESMRSYRYGMQELEMTTRYSLKTVIFMRLLVLGGGNLILLLTASFIVMGRFFISFVYMFTPYFLTAAGSLWIVRNFAGKESNYICFGYALLVTMMEYGSLNIYRFIYEERYLGVWFLALALLVVLSVYEGRCILKQSEALA